MRTHTDIHGQLILVVRCMRHVCVQNGGFLEDVALLAMGTCSRSCGCLLFPVYTSVCMCRCEHVESCDCSEGSDLSAVNLIQSRLCDLAMLDFHYDYTYLCSPAGVVYSPSFSPSSHGSAHTIGIV